MMKYIVLAGVLGVALTGCSDGGVALRAQRAAIASQQTAACEQAYPGKGGNYVGRMTCLNSVMAQQYAGGPNPDLLQVFESKRLVLAGQVDRGEINLDVAREQTAEAWSVVVSTANARAQARNAQAAADQANRLAGAALILQSIPQYQPPVYHPPVQTNCYRFGNNVNCTSY